MVKRIDLEGMQVVVGKYQYSSGIEAQLQAVPL